MIIHECDQGTPAWFDLKLGSVSASHFSSVLNKKTGRGKYMAKLVKERLTGEREAGYNNKDMDRGVRLEKVARRAYENAFDVTIRQVGFVEMDEYVGVSPDGMIGDDGLLEIKCPRLSVHQRYIAKGKLPTTYRAQVQGQLWVAQRQWCDFVSFCLESKTPLFWVRVKRDEEYILNLEYETQKFVAEMKEMICLAKE